MESEEKTYLNKKLNMVVFEQIRAAKKAHRRHQRNTDYGGSSLF